MKETTIGKISNWIQHLEFLVLLVTMLGGIYVIESRADFKFQAIDQRFQIQSQRTDRLYEMFIDLLKEKK
jgi:hypothetical protein